MRGIAYLSLRFNELLHRHNLDPNAAVFREMRARKEAVTSPSETHSSGDFHDEEYQPGDLSEDDEDEEEEEEEGDDEDDDDDEEDEWDSYVEDEDYVHRKRNYKGMKSESAREAEECVEGSLLAFLTVLRLLKYHDTLEEEVVDMDSLLIMGTQWLKSQMFTSICLI